MESIKRSRNNMTDDYDDSKRKKANGNCYIHFISFFLWLYLSFFL